MAWVVVAAYLPMAWDRYLLPIQAPNALLAAVGDLGPLGSVRGAEAGTAWRRIDAPALGVFLILLGSYAFFWHSRDWNTASRLMLTYAMVDRGTVEITGLGPADRRQGLIPRRVLFRQAARLSLAGGAAVCLRQMGLRLPGSSARHRAAIAVLAGGLLDHAGDLGHPHRLDRGAAGRPGTRPGLFAGPAALVGLAYGLATPAYVYATLAYGHQASAFALLAPSC